ncbi:hypothetical protein BH20ACT10_BH20ACT10_15430 [soil metagenome]
MIEKSVPKRTTRHHRADEEFVGLLHEDFGIEVWEFQAAFVGVPSVPKLQAIRLCCWTERATDDVEERGRMIRAWARKRGKGSYNPAIIGG